MSFDSASGPQIPAGGAAATRLVQGRSSDFPRESNWPGGEFRVGRRGRGCLVDPQPHPHVVIEAGQRVLEALHSLLDGELLLLRLLPVLNLERQLALLQLEILDDDDCESREPEPQQDFDDEGERRDQVSDQVRRHDSGRTRPAGISPRPEGIQAASCRGVDPHDEGGLDPN